MGQNPLDQFRRPSSQPQREPSPLERLITGEKEEETPSLPTRIWRGLGGLPGSLATGVRIGTGLAASGGGPKGALIGGGGEALAQNIENLSRFGEIPGAVRDITRNIREGYGRETAIGAAKGAGTAAARIGLESAIGSIPGANLTRGGKFIESAGRSGAMAGTGSIGRDVAAGEDINWERAGYTTLGGGLLGGTIGAFSAPGKINPDLSDADRLAKANEARAKAGQAPRNPNQPVVTQRMELPKDPREADKVGKVWAKEIDDDYKAEKRRLGKELGQFEKLKSEQAKAAEKALAEQEKFGRITGAIDEAGAEPTPPKFNESLSATGPSGERVTMSRRFEAEDKAKAQKLPGVSDEALEGLGSARPVENVPEAILEAPGGIPPAVPQAPVAPQASHPLGKAAADVTNGVKVPEAPVVSDLRHQELLNKLGGRPNGVEPPQAVVMPEVPSAPPVAPPLTITPEIPIETPESVLARFFKTPADAAGTHYKEVKAAAPSEPKLREPLSVLDSKGKPYTSERIAGKSARQEAAAQGIPPLPKTATPLTPEDLEVPRFSPDMVGETPTAGSWVDDALEEAKVIEQGQKAGAVQKPYKPGGNEDGGTTLGAGFGGLQQMLGLAKKYPEFATKVGMTAGGGVAGAMLNEDDPLAGGIAGAGAGFGLSFAPQIASRLGVTSREGVQKITDTITRELPYIQRFNHLMSLHGLAANAVVGPYASGITSSIEAGLKGDRRGWEAAKELMKVFNVAEEVPGALEEAGKRIETVERRTLGQSPQAYQKFFGYPGRALSTGDITIRNILKKVGFSDDEAKVMTLTNEPGVTGSYAGELGKSMVNLQRTGGPWANMMLPFVRTPMNILEQGIERLPIVGAIKGFLQGRKGRDIAAEQAVSIPIAAASYGAGMSLDPETARTARRYVSNAGGRNALTSNIFFAMGQERTKRNPNTPLALGRGMANAIAAPQTDVVEDYGRKISDIITDRPSGRGPGLDLQDFPSGSYPKMFDELSETVNPTVRTSDVEGLVNSPVANPLDAFRRRR